MPTGVNLKVDYTLGHPAWQRCVFRWVPSTHYHQWTEESHWFHPWVNTYTLPFEHLPSFFWLWTRLALIASTGIQFILQTWSQWSESGAKFHPKVRWDDYQHVNLSFTYLTIGKWAQLHIARTISVVGSFIVKAKRQIPSETDSVKCLFLGETNHNFLYPSKHKGTCSISFNKGCSWLTQPYAHIAIGFISFSCHLPILFIYVFFPSDL